MSKNAKVQKLVPIPGGWQPVGKIQVPKDSGAHLIRFELSGNHSGITFKNGQGNDAPIWVQANTKPTQYTESDQIPAWVVSDDGKQLVIVDLNNNDSAKGPIDLHYQLNFVGHPALDPIIENGGGPKLYQPATGQNFLSDASTALVIGLAVLLVIIGGVLGRLTR